MSIQYIRFSEIFFPTRKLTSCSGAPAIPAKSHSLMVHGTISGIMVHVNVASGRADYG